MREEWKDIEGYEGLYQISNKGRVKSLIPSNRSKNGKFILKLTKVKNFYYTVTLYKNGASSSKKVHRLVAEAFLPRIAGKDIVNHLDGNKRNNWITNLEWVTFGENLKHAYEKGLR